MPRLLIEGWRGINHSYALINQQQILAMRAIAGLELFHRDLPFGRQDWNPSEHGDGLDASERDYLQGLPAPERRPGAIDAVYRICSPIRSGTGTPYAGDRTTTCMITELGLSPESFAAWDVGSDFFTRGDNRIATISDWSRDRIVEYGFPADRVHVTPLGADTNVFRPLASDVRAAERTALGIRPDEILFLNIAAPFWNKGIDLLLRAFTVLRLRGLPVRLVIKDQSGLYGSRLDDAIALVGQTHPMLLRGEVLSGITAITASLTRDRVATLIGSADCYVSPYRAEGFNLPALEAIACEIPTIVTAGGATDAFCEARTSLLVPGRFCRTSDETMAGGAYVEPEFDALVAGMAAAAQGWRPEPVAFAQAREAVLARFNWHRAAEETVRLIFS